MKESKYQQVAMLKDLADRLRSLITSEISKEIQRIQSTCDHANSQVNGWEGGRYTECPDCGLTI